VHFGRATAERRSGRLNYDLANWEVIEEVDPAGTADTALRLKSGVLPSVAIDELFAKLDDWAFDCAEFVQVAHLYARRHTLGELFDDPRLFEESGGTLTVVLRPQGSTGMLQGVMFKRETRDEPMTRIPGNVEEERDVDTLLAAAPVGSRVVWRNQLAPPDTYRFNENALKLGPDEFAAHGLDAKKKIYTRAELELGLAQAEEPDADDAYVQENVFIVGIEHLVTP
jgi:hypothetical protein